MIAESQLLPYATIIETLEQHCAARHSGTLFITSQSNASIRFILIDGRIVSMAQRRELGLEALDSIKQMQSGRLRFTPGLMYSPDGQQHLPNTAELIELLLDPDDSTYESSNSSDPVTLFEISEDNLVPAAGTIDKRTVRMVVEFQLTEIVGPMASIICDEHFASAGNYLHQIEIVLLLKSISAEIGDDNLQREVEIKLFGKFTR